jgi:hypothetical protein
MLPQHVFVNLFTTFNLGNEAPSCLCKLTEEPLIPNVLIGVARSWPSPGTDTDKGANLATGPLIHHGFIQSVWSWIESSSTIVVEDGLSNARGLERKADGTRRTPSLPDLAIEFGRRLTS